MGLPSSVEKFDEGKILLQQTIDIEPDDTAFSLFHRQIKLGLEPFEQVVEMTLAGEPGTEQTGEGSYYSRAVPHDGIIDPSWPDEQIDRFIRAMHFPQHPGAIAVIDGQKHEVQSLNEYHSLHA